jgi:uncharacterized protein YlxP (DUF503 family)
VAAEVEGFCFSMFVAIARLSLSIPESGSLKSKRHVLHKVLDKVKARFNVSIAEVADNDLWQRATIGIAAVANDHGFAQESLSKVVRFIEDLYVAPVISCSTEVIPVGGELYGDDDGTSYGSAARGAQRTLAEAEQEAGLMDPEREPPPPSPRSERSPRGGGAARGPKASAERRRPLSEGERARAIEELRERLRRERQQAAKDPGEGEE